jgi:hypothetical protein
MVHFFCARHGQPRIRFAPRWLASALVLLNLCACRTSGTVQPINLSEPGWSVREGQAVWRMPGHRPELAGEMVLALNADGRCFVEFSKTPFPLVRAECGEARWEIEFPPQKLFFAGGGAPPARLAWLQVCRGLAGRQVGLPWHFERRADGSWRLDNTGSQETVEGWLQP